MKVLFRVDASLDMGTGHVMRCLALAKELYAQGASISFSCRAHPGNLIEVIRSNGFPVQVLALSNNIDPDGPDHAHWLGGRWSEDAAAIIDGLPADLDWVVIDHYGLGASFEQTMAAAGASVAVIDDLGNRPHSCDLLLDQTFGRDASAYQDLVSKGTVMLLGSNFALLRPEFSALAAESMQRRRGRPLRRLLITLGGVDIDNVTQRVLDSLDVLSLPSGCEIDVVMGSTAPWLDKVTNRALSMRNKTAVRRGVSNMASLMAESDLAIGAAGSTAWERCCLGLPSLMVVTAENQRTIARNLDEQGAAISLGDHRDAQFASRLERGVLNLLESPDRLTVLSEAAARVTDGHGAGRVARAMMEFSA